MRDKGMKVLQLIHNQQGTGPHAKVVEQAAALQELGVEVTLLCTSRTAHFNVSETTERGVRVVLAPDLLWGRLRQGLDLWNTCCRIRFVGRGSFDVIHAIDARPVVILPALWRKWRLRTPLVLSWWDLFGEGGTARERSGALYASTLGVLEGKWERLFRLKADRATVISNDLRRRLEAIGYPADRILLQRVGCDTRAYGPGDQAAARRALGLPQDARILCYVGALLPSDQKLLIESLTRVIERYDGGDLRVLMVGTPALSQELATRLHVQRIERQPLDVVYRYLAAADLCLLPLCESVANRARWPSKASDYFSAGRPVVTTKVSDFEELFAKYRLGYLADRSTAEAYAETLLQALDRREEWETMGQTCRRFAETELDTRVLARDLAALYADAQRGASRSTH